MLSKNIALESLGTQRQTVSAVGCPFLEKTVKYVERGSKTLVSSKLNSLIYVEERSFRPINTGKGKRT